MKKRKNGCENVCYGAVLSARKHRDFTLKSNQGPQKVSAKVRGTSSIL